MLAAEAALQRSKVPALAQAEQAAAALAGAGAMELPEQPTRAVAVAGRQMV
jgi:hypothetical protein